MIFVLDNYDSFTWNLVHYLEDLGAEVRLARNDAITPAEVLASGAEGVLISPGPGTPDEAGISLALVAACAEAGRPLLGVCLGHQAIGRHFGGRIARASTAMHAKVSAITHDGSALFAGLPSPYSATRYHSLVVAEQGWLEDLTVTARAEDGTIQGLQHRALPLFGVQFHPESIASQHGHRLLGNFLRIAAGG